MIYDKHHPNCYAFLRRQHRVLISGSRTYSDFGQFEKTLNEYIEKLGVNINEVVFVSGGAKHGADAFIEKVCDGDPDKHVIVYPADWDKHGKSAGYQTNAEMINISSQLIAWWDGISKGTKHAIDLARDNTLRLKVFLIKPTQI